jgi:hypothetical protein
MQAATRGSADLSALGSPVYWHFRALPDDVQRVTIRRLALSGLRELRMVTSGSELLVIELKFRNYCLANEDCLAMKTGAGAMPAPVVGRACCSFSSESRCGADVRSQRWAT